MLRIRFHGRGGHGVKTASRIAGTAAFLSGHWAQDSPIYGAERRGAAVVAFTRVHSSPILERGPIADPDIVIVGDESLLSDTASGVLHGAAGASAVFVNTADRDAAVEAVGEGPVVMTADVTRRTLETLGRASALSAGLAAAAVRLSGLVSADTLAESVRTELEELELPPEHVDKNVHLAGEVFRALSPVAIRPREPARAGQLHAPRYHGALAGTPSIFAAGNSRLRRTGSWRLERPEIDRERCTRCGLCFVRCPDGAIALDDEGYPIIDFDHCKGCLICLETCPLEAISAHREVRSW